MTDEQFDKICKKLDKQLQLLTKIAKALHIVPVTENDEREFRKTRVENAQVADKIYSESQSLRGVNNEEGSLATTMQGLLDGSEDVFKDVIGDDI